MEKIIQHHVPFKMSLYNGVNGLIALDSLAYAQLKISTQLLRNFRGSLIFRPHVAFAKYLRF